MKNFKHPMKKKFDIENLLKKYWKNENNKYYQKLQGG